MCSAVLDRYHKGRRGSPSPSPSSSILRPGNIQLTTVSKLPGAPRQLDRHDDTKLAVTLLTAQAGLITITGIIAISVLNSTGGKAALHSCTTFATYLGVGHVRVGTDPATNGTIPGVFRSVMTPGHGLGSNDLSRLLGKCSHKEGAERREGER